MSGSLTTGLRCLTDAPLRILITMLMFTLPASGVQLPDFRWTHRPLLIFARDHQSPGLAGTLHALTQRKCEINDRDMIVGVIVSQGQSILGGKEISVLDAAAFRHHYGITNMQFSVLLIGKDVGEKLRSHRIPDLDTVFGLIDSMPMRQCEMSTVSSDCGEVLQWGIS